jgi:hypothetical protein
MKKILIRLVKLTANAILMMSAGFWIFFVLLGLASDGPVEWLKWMTVSLYYGILFGLPLIGFFLIVLVDEED